MTVRNKIAIQRMFDNEKSISDISKELNTPRNTVHSFVKKLDGNRVCLQCGCIVKSVAGARTKKFCSDKCRMSWWNTHTELMNHRIQNFVVCEHCGAQFISHRNRSRHFCSKSCYAASRKKVTK